MSTVLVLGSPLAGAASATVRNDGLNTLLYLADLDGDGKAEILQPHHNEVFGMQADFDGAEVLHATYRPRYTSSDRAFRDHRA